MTQHIELDRPAPPRRRRVAVAASAVVLTAAAAAVVVASLHGGSPRAAATAGAGAHRTAAHRTAQPDNRIIRAGSPDPDWARTVAAVARLMAGTPVLPHAQRLSHAPVPALAEVMSEPGYSSHIVRWTSWWTAPGSVHAALSYFNTHRPPGLSADGSGSTGGPGVGTQDLFYGGVPTSAYESPTVDVEVATFGSGVAVRVDAYAVWLPSRTADSIIHDPTSVTVTLQARSLIGSKPPSTVRKTLPAGAAGRLGRLVNGLDGGVFIAHGCPAMSVEVDDTLVFRTAHGAFTVRDSTNPCADTASVRTPAGRQYLLQRGTLHEAVLAALDLRSFGGR